MTKHYISWYQTWKLYPQLPMKAKSILPDQGMAPKVLNVATLYIDSAQELARELKLIVQIYPKPERKLRSDHALRYGHAKFDQSFKHRVMCACPTCDRLIPFGRMQQHFPTCSDVERKVPGFGS